MKNLRKLVKPLDISVTCLATLSCLLIYLEIPVWSLFIGWAWYYALGSKLHVFKEATPPMLLGSLLAVVCFLIMDVLAFLPPVMATMIGVFITVLSLMLVLKIPGCGASLPAFNAYSCMFIGYAAKAYMEIDTLPPLFNAFIWITGANFFGLIFGWLSLAVEKKLLENGLQ